MQRKDDRKVPDHGWGLALLLVLLTPTLMFPGALPGPRVVSGDDHLSVHHAFQTSPGGSVHNPVLSDPALQLKALRNRVVASLKKGDAPLWNPDIFAGAPLLADGQSMVGSPVTWFHLFLPENTAQDLGVWWTLIWLGLGTFLLLESLGAGPMGAAAGAVAAMTGPFPGVWLLFPLCAAFAWIPWVLWGLERCRGGSGPLWLAFATAGLLAGGHPDPAVYGLGLALFWALVRARRLSTVLGLTFGMLLSAPIWLPFLEFLHRSDALTVRGGYRLAPGQLLDLLWPGWYGHPAGKGYTGPGAWEDSVIHPGLAALALVPFAWKNRGARALAFLWLCALIFSLTGLPGPLHHSRLAEMGAWLLALAAGLGVARLPRGWGLAALAGVLATGLWARRLDNIPLSPERHDPAPAAWTRALAAKTGEGRVVGLGWALQPNTGALAGLRDIRGYDLPVSRDWERFARHLDPQIGPLWYRINNLTPENENLLRFAAVRFVLSPEVFPGMQPVDVGPSPLQVHALDPRAPRAWLTTGAQGVAGPEEAIRLVESDPAARAGPPVENLPGEWPRHGMVTPVRLFEEGANQVRIDVAPMQSSLLVLADAWAPGWRVEVDGRSRPVLRVAGYFRGVVVETGEKEVCFRYAPSGWRWGIYIGLAGLLGLFLEVAARRFALFGAQSTGVNSGIV